MAEHNNMIEQELKRKLSLIAQRQIKAGVDFKKPRIKQIQKFEDMYANKVTKALKNRFNIPLPILSGFVDTLKSKIDDAPIITFTRREEADTKIAKKVSALWEKDSGDDNGQWAFIDRLVKNLAIFSGRGIYKIFSESDPQYKSYLEPRDYYDFYCEPQGGPDLEKHIFLGEQNIFKTKDELIQGSAKGYYDRRAVLNLITSNNASNGLKIQKDVEQKLNRSRSLNLDANANNFVGEDLYNLTEHYMVYEGVRYCLLLEESTGICIRAEKLADLFEVDPILGDALWPYVSFATHEDNYNFWSKGPCDDIYPVAEATRIIFNQSLDNLQKRNWNQRAFDDKIFPDPSKLEWRPDGLVNADIPAGKSIRDGIYEFQTNDTTTITVNLMGFIDNFIGQKTGITPGAQGASDGDKKVGIFFGEMEQVADRLGLTNKIYKGAWAQLGKRWLRGVKAHLNEKTAVQILGSNGIEWDELDKNEITDLNIKVSGGSDDAKFNEMEKQRKIAVLDKIIVNPTLVGKINADWIIEEQLKTGGYDPEDIKRAIDVNNFGDQDLMTEAAKAIQDILKGKKVKINRGATTGFIQKIIDFAWDTELNEKEFDSLIAYAESHIMIATDNMARKAQSIVRERNIATAQPQAPGMPLNAPVSPAMPKSDVMPKVQSYAEKSARMSQGVPA
jgi:hypothetical protein